MAAAPGALYGPGPCSGPCLSSLANRKQEASSCSDSQKGCTFALKSNPRDAV